jgi:hypothetical protein
MRPPDLIRSPTSSRRRAGAVRRRLLSPTPGRERTAQSAGIVLGRTHPLTRAIAAGGSVGRQWWTCAAALAGALIARMEGDAWAVGVAVSAGLVLLTLTVVLLALRQRTRDEAVHLIAEGREALPIAVVQRQRQRLLSPRTKQTLARTLETMLRQALRPPRIMTRGARPLFSVRVIAGVAPDLRAVVSVLQTQDASARGVALLERLITHANSPLYGCEAAVLREELRSVRSALGE